MNPKLKESDHAGKGKIFRVDITCGVTPALTAIAPSDVSDADIEDRVKLLQTKFIDVLDETFGREMWNPSLPKRFLSTSLSHEPEPCLSFEDQQKRRDESLGKLRGMFEEAEEKREEDWSNHPKNGTEGWWTVSGIRHSKTVWASSAPEARKLAEDEVGDWEAPDIYFEGSVHPTAKQLPTGLVAIDKETLSMLLDAGEARADMYKAQAEGKDPYANDSVPECDSEEATKVAGMIQTAVDNGYKSLQSKS